MIQAIEREIGGKAKYLGVPSCAYEIGSFTVGKNGELEFGDFDDLDEVAPIVDACVMATGVRPAEWDNNEKGAKAPDCEPEKGADEDDTIELTVRVPLEKVDLGNLIHLLEAKGELIKKALGIENTFIKEENEEVQFPWFTNIKPEEALAYTKFIAAICEMSVKQKRITAKPKENENEKYAFRCFLLRLGFIGDEFKADRKILLSKLDGSSAFKSGQKGGEQ
ncbi:MAG: virulence [Lachnospiraceae bacterium]|nr:virulence [Lachnospiraceae bacterium]